MTTGGEELDIHIDSFDEDSSQEFYLTSDNYEELFVMAYDSIKTVILHVHIDKIYFEIDDTKCDSMMDKCKTEIKEENNSVRFKREPKFDEELKTEVPVTFCGIPIDMDGFKQNENRRSEGRLLEEIDDETPIGGAYVGCRSHRGQFSPKVTSFPKQSNSPISIHDDDDFLVQDMQSIVPFAQESIKSRVADLQSIAITSIPDVLSIPKLLKSHNMAFKKDENASTWYQRFHNFCAMIGISPSKGDGKE
jgi:hypothetical protein